MMQTRGVYTALATPFLESGEIDFNSLEKILTQQLHSGIRGWVVSGTTAESPTLTALEKEKLFKFVLEFSKGKQIDLVAGTGTNDTRESIALTAMAFGLGYRKFLIVVPYYNKPSQAGLLAHFTAIADSILEGTIILYNVPGRTGISLSPETVVALSGHPRIRALKEASGDLGYLKVLRSKLAEAKRELDLLSGDDATYLAFIQEGGHGVISVASHVCPRAMIEIERAIFNKNNAEADRIQADYLPIFRDLFIESNPVPLKWMLSRLGLCENRFRLPLVPISEENAKRLASLMGQYRIERGELRK